MNTNNNTPRIADLHFVYVKTKDMKHFMPIDLSSSTIVKNLIFASMIEDKQTNREKLQRIANDNSHLCAVFQMRQNSRVTFQTSIKK